MMRESLTLLLSYAALVASAQPTSLPTKITKETSLRNASPYWTVAGYAALNVGLFYGAHTMHAAREAEVKEDPNHLRFDAALADSLVFTGLAGLAVGYVYRQKAAQKDLLSTRLFWGTAALSGASTTLLYSLANALKKDSPEASARATFVGTLSLSFAVGSITTALALRRSQ